MQCSKPLEKDIMSEFDRALQAARLLKRDPADPITDYLVRQDARGYRTIELKTDQGWYIMYSER